jgi:hypothetical protein
MPPDRQPARALAQLEQLLAALLVAVEQEARSAALGLDAILELAGGSGVELIGPCPHATTVRRAQAYVIPAG